MIFSFNSLTLSAGCGFFATAGAAARLATRAARLAAGVLAILAGRFGAVFFATRAGAGLGSASLLLAAGALTSGIGSGAGFASRSAAFAGFTSAAAAA